MSFSIASGSHALVSGAQVLRCITVELTRRRESKHLRRTEQVEKHAPAARVQRFVGPQWCRLGTISFSVCYIDRHNDPRTPIQSAMLYHESAAVTASPNTVLVSPST